MCRERMKKSFNGGGLKAPHCTLSYIIYIVIVSTSIVPPLHFFLTDYTMIFSKHFPYPFLEYAFEFQVFNFTLLVINSSGLDFFLSWTFDVYTNKANS